MMPTGIAMNKQATTNTNTTTGADSTTIHNSAGTTIAGQTSCGSTGQQDVINANGIDTSISPTG